MLSSRFEVVCVFDAAGAGELKDKEEDHLGVRVVFACKSADEYIEKETKRLQGVRTVWAASNDQGIQASVLLSMSPTSREWEPDLFRFLPVVFCCWSSRLLS